MLWLTMILIPTTVWVALEDLDLRISQPGSPFAAWLPIFELVERVMGS